MTFLVCINILLRFLTNISLYTVLMDWEEDDDISGPDSADDSDPEKLESKEKKAKKLDAFLTRSGESIDKKEETGEYTAEEAIVAKNRLDLTYRKPHNKLVEEVKRIKNRREIESKLENQEEEEEEEVPWDDSDNLNKLRGMTESLNKKRKSIPSDIENDIPEREVKKPKLSEQSSDKLPADGLSPLDWVVQEQQCERPQDRDISDTFNDDN